MLKLQRLDQDSPLLLSLPEGGTPLVYTGPPMTHAYWHRLYSLPDLLTDPSWAATGLELPAAAMRIVALKLGHPLLL